MPKYLTKFSLIIVTTSLLATLTACGQKGALYLPQKPTTQTIHETAEPTPNPDTALQDTTNDY